LLEDRLDHAIRHAHRTGLLLAVIFIDLDEFKNVNDSLGHSVGDELLLQFTNRVRGCLREDDTLARLGGDEFIVLLPEMANIEHVLAVADRLIDTGSRPYEVQGHTLNVGSSLGISLYPEDGKTVGELINGADVAMYRSKRDGRNRYNLFSPKVHTSA